MSKKVPKTGDTKESSAMTTEATNQTSDVVDNSNVSTKKKVKYEKPTMMQLDELESFDPSASHVDESDDDKFDDDEDVD